MYSKIGIRVSESTMYCFFESNRILEKNLQKYSTLKRGKSKKKGGSFGFIRDVQCRKPGIFGLLGCLTGDDETNVQELIRYLQKRLLTL